MREQGLHAPVCYTSIQEKDLDTEELWPFYAKAEELNVPIIVHPVNTGPLAGGWRLTRHYATRGYGFWSALGNAIENSLALANLMFGGVLDAFPKLRFCFMEGGSTQVPHLLEGLMRFTRERGITIDSNSDQSEGRSNILTGFISPSGPPRVCWVCSSSVSEKIIGSLGRIILMPIRWEAGPIPFRLSWAAQTFRKTQKRRFWEETR